MNKKYKIAIIIVGIVVILGTSAWSYNLGLSQNLNFEAIKIMVIAKRQNECFAKSDIKCAEKANKILVSITAAQLARLNKSGISLADQNAINEYILWSKTINQ